MKGSLILFVVVFIALNFTGCSLISSSGTVQLPTAAQLNAVCAVEKASGKTGVQAPDCVAAYAFQQSCNVAALGEAVNPLVATINPVVGSILTTGAAITVATCTQQGFYAPPVPITIAAPVAKS